MEQAHAEWQQKNRRNLSVGKKNVVDFFGRRRRRHVLQTTVAP